MRIRGPVKPLVGISCCTKQFGIYSPQYKAAYRTTFLIDKEGKIVEIKMDSEAIDPTAIVASCERRKLKS